MIAVLRFLPAFAVAAIGIRFLAVCTVLAGSLPEGPWPAIRFGLVAVIVCFAPGLALLRVLRRDEGPKRGRLDFAEPIDASLFVLSTSLAATGFVSWSLYFCGLYTLAAAIAMLAVFAVAGAWGGAPLLDRRALRAGIARLRAVPPRAWIGPLVAALFLESVFEAAFGEPFQGWDAVVSWDKWAFDMGVRTGLGLQLLGGYPQMVPAIASVFYKVAAVSPETAMPVEQTLLHGFFAIYPAMIVLALFSLGRRYGFPALLALGLLAACDAFASDLVSGQADIPIAAFAAALAALLRPLVARGGRRAFLPLALLFFATVFAKGAGAVFAAVLVLSTSLRGKRRPLLFAVAAFATAVAFSAPYLFHQMWIDAHPEIRDTSPFLVSLPFHAAHTRLFTPDFKHLVALLRLLVEHKGASALAPPAAALSILFAGLAAALVRRRTRMAAIALLALFLFWFFTASYDWRNAYPTLVFGAAILASAVSLPARTKRTTRTNRTALLAASATVALLLSLVATAVGGMVRSGAMAKLCTPVVRRWSPPRTVRLPPERRHMASRNTGRLRNILSVAPWAARAEHVWTGSPRFRLLAPKGCYTTQCNAWCDVRPGDLYADAGIGSHPPNGFVRIARLRHLGAFGTLWMFRPDLAPGLVLEIPAPDTDTPPARDLFGTVVADDPFAAWLAPVRDGDVIRLPNPDTP